MVGESPETVFATGGATNPITQEVGDLDTAAAIFRYPGGATAMVDVSRYVSGGYDQRVEVRDTWRIPGAQTG